jgi:uncharacterized repeat protein (TIGR03803 family)
MLVGRDRSSWVGCAAIVVLSLLLVLGGSTVARGQAPYTVLHSFNPTPQGFRPRAALVQGKDGDFYGVTDAGGAFGAGTIFRMTPSGTVTTLHVFDVATEGSSPAAALIQAIDGDFYGTTAFGGQFNAGTIFRISPAGALTVLHTFTGTADGAHPFAALVQHADGWLYGTTPEGGQFSWGVAFRISPDGVMTVLHHFAGGTADGARPGRLITGMDGNLYGTTSYGGASAATMIGHGTAFRMTHAGEVTILHSFRGGAQDASIPISIVLAADGNFYGTSELGGSACNVDLPCPPGTAFRMAPDGTVTVLHVWNSPVFGGYPSGLVAATDGKFYGTFTYPSSIAGAVFRMEPTGAMSVFYTLIDDSQGRYLSDLVQASDGKFYGTGRLGGINDRGTIFNVDTNGIFSVLYRFAPSPEGANPAGPLLQASDGNLYGTTHGGGLFEFGTLFRIAPDGALTILHHFECGRDGGNPGGLLIEGRDGRLYGTTFDCGGQGRFDGGVAFAITVNGAFTTLYTFASGFGGPAFPLNMIQTTDQDFYGTTFSGGASGIGTVFRLTPDGTVSIAHAFTVAERRPGQLLQAQDGNLYGLTARSVYRLTLGGVLTILHQFDDAESRSRQILEGADGNLYGVTSGCPDVFFRLSLTGAYTQLASMPAPCVGSVPTIGAGRNGALYLTQNSGRVFSATSSGMITLVLESNDIADARNVFEAADGMLYGVTSRGGAFNGGSLFRVNVHVPLRPAFVIARPGPAGGIRLIWANVVDATSYTVTRLVNGQATIVASGLGATSVIDPVAIQPGSDVMYTVTAVGANGASLPSVPLTLPWASVTSRTPTIMLPADYDGDGAADITVYRPGDGEWLTLRSLDGRLSSVSWGSGDRPVPADYDGDGLTDVAVYRQSSGEWFGWQPSRCSISPPSPCGGLWQVQMGSPALGDLPVPADYDGDGRADLAVYRQATGQWFILPSLMGQLRTVWWGAPALGDLPVPGDYDGDGKADIAVYRDTTGEWFVLNSATETLLRVEWGGPDQSDIPVPADFDRDGRLDIAVYRATTSEWFINGSSGVSVATSWGAVHLSDVPVPADYDGNGHADIAVYRVTTGEWFIRPAPYPGASPYSGPNYLRWGAPSLLDSVRPY